MKTFEDLQKLETHDFQRRGGNYPKAGVPDSIEVYKAGHMFEVAADFKNTDEETGKAWLERYVSQQGFKVKRMESRQDGDYHNDWIRVFAIIDFS
jgi:hypothetical protein